jgi:hypothetical protein
MSRQADEADRPSPGDAPGLEAFNALLRRTLVLPPKPHSEMKLGKPHGRRLKFDFARSGGPAGDEQKALEEAGGDFRALRVGP